MKGGEKKRNLVAVRLTDAEKEKLDRLATTLDRSCPWIIRRLLSEATVERLQALCGGNER
jgi:predicted transcriptional regulator